MHSLAKCVRQLCSARHAAEEDIRPVRAPVDSVRTHAAHTCIHNEETRGCLTHLWQSRAIKKMLQEDGAIEEPMVTTGI